MIKSTAQDFAALEKCENPERESRKYVTFCPKVNLKKLKRSFEDLEREHDFVFRFPDIINDLEQHTGHRKWPKDHEKLLFDMRKPVVKDCHTKNLPIQTLNTEDCFWGSIE